MNSKTIFALIAFAAVLTVAALIGVNREESKVSDDQRGKNFLVQLDEKINDVAKIEINQGGHTTTLARQDTGWTLSERYAYAADTAQIKQLLLSLAQLKTIEQKTSKPEHYAKLGVDEPTASSTNKKITLSDKDGKTIAAVIVGNGKGAGMYVRAAESSTAWLVEGNIMLPGVVSGWLEKTVLEIPPEKIQKITISPPKGDKIELARLKDDDKEFVVTTPKLKDAGAANEIASIVGALTKLQLDDVKPRNEVQSQNQSLTPHVTAYLLKTGEIIAVSNVNNAGKAYIWVDITRDDTVTSDKADASLLALKEKLTPWAFEVAEFKANNFRKSIADLRQKPSK